MIYITLYNIYSLNHDIYNVIKIKIHAAIASAIPDARKLRRNVPLLLCHDRFNEASLPVVKIL